MSDDGGRDEAVVPQKNGGKVTTAPENKVGGKTSLAPVVAEKLTSPHRKTATWAKLPKDRRSAKKRSGNDEEEEDKNTELGQDGKEPIKKTPDKWKKEMAKQKASPEIKKQRLEGSPMLTSHHRLMQRGPWTTSKDKDWRACHSSGPCWREKSRPRRERLEEQHAEK
ncbi:uncharacterized protein LOC122481897 isoform X3 [Prionailurus bengalensis]|uniref:uncharacterized protein LOC122481897 isoform X3 n=1 Tax=Prionailurus bengalensis TaxID=37029 RepID=UPI001CA7C41B|nr:uncharacterized protein LOC122481897 isoform X3 [Prionailurus bengalensis]